MTPRPLLPPSGSPPPASASLGTGAPLDLLGLAREICRRYGREFPDEQERYGDAGNEWCIHDNQHLLNWGAGAVSGYIEMNYEVAWLAKVLEARRFPIERLARDLDTASEVVRDQVTGSGAEQLAEVLEGAAKFVRSRDTFLD